MRRPSFIVAFVSGCIASVAVFSFMGRNAKSMHASCAHSEVLKSEHCIGNIYFDSLEIKSVSVGTALYDSKRNVLDISFEYVDWAGVKRTKKLSFRTSRAAEAPSELRAISLIEVVKVISLGEHSGKQQLAEFPVFSKPKGES